MERNSGDNGSLYERKAVNPYNFVPFYSGADGAVRPPSRKALDEYYPDSAELKSGWIDVKLTAKTPLIIPDGSRYRKAEVEAPHRPGALAVPENRRDNAPDPDRFLKQYEFFRHPDGRCAIPGSSLRGMLRSMYEAASNSCLPFLLKDPIHPISQRTPLYAAFKNRGLLEYDRRSRRWRLLKVIKHRIPTTGEAVRTGVFQWGGETYHTAQKVRFALTTGDGAESVALGEGNGEGVLQFNVPVDLKNHYNVMVLEPIQVHDEKTHRDKYQAVEGWDEWLDELDRQQDRDNKNEGAEKECEKIFQSIYGSVFDTVRNVRRSYSAQRDLKDALDRARRGEGTLVPVYWFKVERTVTKDGEKKTVPLYYLSGAAAGRVQQRRKWEDIMGPHSPCETLDIPSAEEQERERKRLHRERRYGLCPACALFGTIQDGGTRGRLRFTDAVAVTEPELTTHTLQILGEPRSSSFEFYLRKPDKDATYWNYDFYGVTRKEVKDGKTVEWTEYRDLPQATPRGRKFYWHSKPARDWDDELDKDKRKDLSASMEAASAGTEFTFRVYFDRITEEQFRDLLWLITLGDNREDSPLQYKLGHAKPLGYGSVKLTAAACTVRTVHEDFSMETEKREIPEKPDCSFPIDNDTLRSLLRMCDSRTTAGQDVEYLTGMDYISRERREKPMIYAWFRENRVRADNVQILPEPLDADLRLPTEMRGKRKGGFGGRAYRGFGGSFGQNQVNRLGETSGRFRPKGPVSDADFAAAKERYPIGTRTTVTVRQLAPGGAAFVTLEGTNCDGYLKGRSDITYNAGDRVTVRVINHDEKRKSITVEAVE